MSEIFIELGNTMKIELSLSPQREIPFQISFWTPESWGATRITVRQLEELRKRCDEALNQHLHPPPDHSWTIDIG